MSEKITKSYRGVAEDLVKDVQHLAIDQGRTEGDLLNEALMLLIRAYETKKNIKQSSQINVPSKDKKELKIKKE